LIKLSAITSLVFGSFIKNTGYIYYAIKEANKEKAKVPA
jgi:hypothetical protein